MLPSAANGGYELGFPIGAGGMAIVRYGRRRAPYGFVQAVAIKELHPHLASNRELVAMFLDEARLAGRIAHPNVVATIDVVAEEGRIWSVMPYVEGESLAALAASARMHRVAPPTAIAVAIMLDVLSGLDAAHRATDDKGEPLGIVHRDVSPQNVIVGSDGVARVLDFGVAKARGRMHETRDGQVKGKLAYMAPEQLGGDASIASDVYSAGIVFWELLANARLFDADNELELVGQVLSGVTAPLLARVATSPEIDAVVMRALAIDPGDRFASAGDMANALTLAARGTIASRSEVGAWVEALAKERLAERRALAAAMASGAARMPKPSDPPGAFVRTVVMPPSRVKSPPRRRAGFAVGIALAAFAALGGSMAFARTNAGLLSASAHANASDPSPSPSPRPNAAPTELPPPPAIVAPPMPEPTAPVKNVVSVSPAKRASTRAAPAPLEPAPPAAAECDPPFVVDANGVRRYKRACLR